MSQASPLGIWRFEELEKSICLFIYLFFLKGKPRWLTAQKELGMRQIKPESKVVTPTDLKGSPGFFAELQKERERKSKKERDKGRVGEMQVLLSETASAAPSLPV